MNQVAKREEGQVVQADATSIMEVISRAASDPNTDVDKLERLMAMAERMEARKAEREYAEAMNAAQEEMRPISQDMKNTETKSKYASFSSLDAAIRPIYIKHGFSLSFDTGTPDKPDDVRVICKVKHKGGHSETPHIDIPADGKGPKGGAVMSRTHATMSAVSYGRRGLEKMIFNLSEVGDDDDGNAAGSGEKITTEQVEEIRDLISETKTDIEKFCAYLKVEAIPDIELQNYGRAIAMLQKKRGGK